MKLHSVLFFAILIIVPATVCGQSLDDAKKWYQEGRYAEALPVFQTASKKKIPEAYLYLGELYSKMYRFADAEKEFAKYEKANRRKRDALAKLVPQRKYAENLKQLLQRTEDIQIIDSVVVPKSDFLQAYKLSASAGELQLANETTTYRNERNDKLFYSQSDSISGSKLYSMEKLLDTFGNEQRLSESVNQQGNQAYPFVMPDGLTIYFASTGHESMGGYDLFVTRYNMASNAYLTPNRLNMPFNSPFNDYMMAIDEEKGIGWFASDRFQPTDSVCVYTFIPAASVTLLESDNADYMTNRARISSIKDTWKPDTDYSPLLQRAHKTAHQQRGAKKDFEFVINDEKTYYRLSDFRNEGARALFSRAMDMENRLHLLENDLSEKRAQIIGGSNASSLKTGILNLEKESEGVYTEIELLKLRARNEEIRNTF